MGPKSKGKAPPPPVPALDPKEMVTELEKEFFDFQLADIDKKLSRIATREEVLHLEKQELEEKIEEFKKEKGAIVDDYKQHLADKEEEKCRKREETLSYGEEIKARIERHKNKIESLKQKYQEMVTELSAKLEEMEEEVAVMEDFKQNKNIYYQNLEKMEREMEELEVQHQRNLFEINMKWEKAKVKVKKELQSQLLQLSIEFRQTSQQKIGNPCHRVTQENKAIKTALLQMKEEILEYEEKYEKSLKNMKNHKMHRDKKKEDNDKIIARTSIQIYVIKTLKKQQMELLKKLTEFREVDLQNKMLLKRLNALIADVARMTSSIATVEQDIANKIEDTNNMKEAEKLMRKNLRRLRVLTRNAVKIADEVLALKLIPLGGMEEERHLTFDAKMNLFRKRRENVFNKRGRILQYLLEFLSKAQPTEEDQKLLTASTESLNIEDINFGDVYGKPLEKEVESKTSLTKEVEEEPKGPVFYSSLTSLPRSVSEIQIQQEGSMEGSLEGEFEEYGEDREVTENLKVIVTVLPEVEGEVEEEEEEGEREDDLEMKPRARVHEDRKSKARIHEMKSRARIHEETKSRAQLHEMKSRARIQEETKSKVQLQDLSKSKAQLHEMSKSKVQLQDMSKSKAQLHEMTKSKVQLQDMSKSKAQLHEMTKSRARIQEDTKSKVRIHEDTKSKVRIHGEERKSEDSAEN